MEHSETISMKCPICGNPVTKRHEWSRDIKNPICANEFYVHYVDFTGAHTLIKHPEEEIEVSNTRFNS